MKTLTHNNARHIALAALAAVSLASVTLGAHADGTANDVPAVTVRYADLNLDTQAGAGVLYQRIRKAAQQVCGDAHSRQFAEAAAAKACVDGAVLSSVRTVNSRQLTHEYEVRYGVAPKAINVASVR